MGTSASLAFGSLRALMGTSTSLAFGSLRALMGLRGEAWCRSFDLRRPAMRWTGG
jgi:hypothetical protein